MRTQCPCNIITHMMHERKHTRKQEHSHASTLLHCVLAVPRRHRGHDTAICFFSRPASHIMCVIICRVATCAASIQILVICRVTTCAASIQILILHQSHCQTAKPIASCTTANAKCLGLAETVYIRRIFLKIPAKAPYIYIRSNIRFGPTLQMPLHSFWPGPSFWGLPPLLTIMLCVHTFQNAQGFFTLHGEDALFAARRFFNTTAVVKYLGKVSKIGALSPSLMC